MLITTTARGTWATPADQIAWTPPGFAHNHRTYGVTDIRLIEIPHRRCPELPSQPGIFAVSALLREALLALTGGREFGDGPRDRLREVIVDELVTMPEQPLHLVWTTNLVAFMIGGGMYALYALYPIFAQLPRSTGYAYGASLWETGLYLLPLAAAAGISTTFAGTLEKRIGAVLALVIACLVTACGFADMLLFHAHPDDMIVSLSIVGFGLGMGLPTLFTNVLYAVPAEHVGQTSGMNTVVRMVGGAIGTQVVSSLITSSARHGVPRLAGFTRSLIVEVALMVVAAAAASLLANRRGE